MKKFLSTILAVVMVLGSMATVAFADGETATGTIKVNGVEYSSISAAEAAAGVGGTINISGTIYLSSREGIETDGLTLIGDGTAVITTADNFSAASDKNRKSVLNVEGAGVTIENITFDGGSYGANLVPDSTEATEFNVLRINEGTVTLKNVTINNSKRTLLSVGTSTSSATVTADGLYCEAFEKTVNGANTYADVNVVNGELILNKGLVNGFIAEDYGWESLKKYQGTFTNNLESSHFTLDYTFVDDENYIIPWEITQTLTSTYVHYVKCYDYAVTNGTSDVSVYVDSINDNMDMVGNMMVEARKAEYAAYKTSFGNLLLAASENANDANKTILVNYAAELGVTQEG